MWKRFDREGRYGNITVFFIKRSSTMIIVVLRLQFKYGLGLRASLEED